MSLDVWLTCECEQPCCSKVLFEYNITHNLATMAGEAGLYEAMWRPDEQGWTHAEHIEASLQEGLQRLVGEPSRFRALNPGNGWGTYEGLVAFATKYLEAVQAHPAAKIEVWR